MARRVIAAVVMSICAAVLATLPVQAASATTADLIPGPPAGSWESYPDGTGPQSASDLFGSRAGSVKGFSDAYTKAWSQPPALGLADRLEHYTGVFWAAFRFGGWESVEAKNKSHSSYTVVAGFGSGAYEYTDPPDPQGLQADTLVFVQGDYIAVISMASKGLPDHSALMDQANRQLGQVPLPVDEYTAIGNGVTHAILVVAGVVGVITVLAGAIVLILFLRSRRARPANTGLALTGLNLSPDRRYWWDGHAWRDADATRPPGAYVAPDGRWWDGVVWRASPPG